MSQANIVVGKKHREKSLNACKCKYTKSLCIFYIYVLYTCFVTVDILI